MCSQFRLKVKKPCRVGENPRMSKRRAAWVSPTLRLQEKNAGRHRPVYFLKTRPFAPQTAPPDGLPGLCADRCSPPRRGPYRRPHVLCQRDRAAHKSRVSDANLGTGAICTRRKPRCPTHRAVIQLIPFQAGRNMRVFELIHRKSTHDINRLSPRNFHAAVLFSCPDAISGVNFSQLPRVIDPTQRRKGPSGLARVEPGIIRS